MRAQNTSTIVDAIVMPAFNANKYAFPCPYGPVAFVVVMGCAPFENSSNDEGRLTSISEGCDSLLSSLDSGEFSNADGYS